MFKSIFIPIIVSVLSLFNFFSGDVSVELNMPTTANAGGEFLVEVTISKGDIEGYARFQQDLPVGFTAVPRQTMNGDFRFEDQKVKIQWMKLPYDKDMVITYAVQVGPTVSGTFDFEGKFSYILDNGVQTAVVPAHSITIIGDETAAGTAEQANTSYSYQNVNLKNVDCIRQKPYLNENNEVIVNLLINKGDLKEFGKIQEQVPRGYRAESLRSKNGIFTFQNSIIKFLWMNMPSDPQFVVSYKLIPEGEIPDQAFIITGTFSYAENDRTKTINIADRDVDLSKFTSEEMVAQNTPSETSTATQPQQQTQTPPPAQTQQVETPVETETQQTENVADVTPPVTEQPKTEPKPTQNTYTPPAVDKGALADLTSATSGDEGIGYRVQIAAGHNLVDEKYFRKLNVTDEVQIELHEGWHKYTVGNFPDYKDARDYRVYIWNNTPIHDAFVAAYNNGLRITVQEALMIANQKWYK